MRLEPNGTGSDDESLDYPALKETVALVLRAPLRRKKLSFAIVATVMTLGGAIGSRWQPSYEAQASILVQRNVALPNFSDPSRNGQGNDFDPIAGASESIKGHANL